MSESKWSGAGGGTGNITGPNSSTDKAIVRWNGTTGAVIQDSSASVSDSGVLTDAGTIDSSLTANTAIGTNGSKQLISSATTFTELGYLSGVTSAIQTQINTKAPTANPTFTGTVTLAADPTLALQAATKQYVDTVATGLNPKTGVLCATTANITLSGEQTLDGVTTSTSRVLVKNQSTASQNGLYTSSSGAWTRTTDMDTWAEVPSAYIFVQQGTTLADTGWVCTSDAGGTIGSTAINWTQFAGVGNVTNASVAAAAAIAYSKLASMSTGQVLLGNAGTPTATTLSGDVTVGATGVTAIGSGKVTNTMLAGSIDLTTKVTGILPTANGGTGVNTSTGASSVMLRDANQNTAVANLLEGYSTTATAAGTTTLTVSSNYQQYFTGSTTQTIVLPVTSTLVLGQQYQIVNLSTGVVTINSSGGNLVATVAPSSTVTVTCILTSGTSAASWSSVSQTGTSSNALGGINYITNPNDANAGWAVVTAGTPMTVATTTTTGDLPLGAQVTTAIKITSRSSAGAETAEYISFPFTTPASGGVKTPITFYMRPGTNFIASEWTVSIYQSTTRQSLSTDSSGVTYLPNNTGLFQTTCDLLASTAYTLRFSRPVNAGANAGVLNLAGVFVGLQNITQGAAISDWQSYTPVITNVTTSATSGFWRRVGSSMEFIVRYAASAAPSGVVQIPLPTGYTINTAALANGSSGDDTFGVAVEYPATGNIWTGTVVYATTTTVKIISDNRANFWNATIPYAGANTDRVFIRATVPIAEWAGNGTVNLGAGCQEEYVSSTTGTWDAAAAAGNTVYGPAGSPVSGALTAQRIKVCRLQYPLQATDRLQIQFQNPSTGGWIDQEMSGWPNVSWPAASFSAFISAATIGSTDVSIAFNRYAYPGGTYNNSTGTDYSSANYINWRLVRYKSSAPVGFSRASYANGFGLMAPAKGQYQMTVTSSAAGWSTVRASGVYYQDQDGNHRLKFNIAGTQNSGTITTETLTITGVVAKNVSGYYQPVSAILVGSGSGSYQQAYASPGLSTITINFTSNTGTTGACVSGDIELDSVPSWV